MMVLLPMMVMMMWMKKKMKTNTKKMMVVTMAMRMIWALVRHLIKLAPRIPKHEVVCARSRPSPHHEHGGDPSIRVSEFMV